MQNESCVHLSEFLREKRDDISTSPYTMGVFAVCYSLIIVSGIIGNLCTILAICRTRSLQTVPNMFILSLSCSDIVVCCTSATITPITAFKKNWIFGSLLCSVAPFIAGVSLCFSTFTLATISIDRFILIRFPMKKPLSHAQASVAILMICVLAVVLCTPIMLAQDLDGFGDYCGMFCYENWGVHQSLKRVYGTLLITLQFIVPLIIIIFCYTAISVRLGQSLILKGGPKSKKGNEWQPAMTEQQKAANKRRQRTNRMFIAMVLAFSFSWFANILFNVLRDYDMLPPFVKKQEFFYGILTHCIAMTSTVWNPLLYAALNFQLRAAFIQLMPICIKEFFHLRVSSGRPTTTIVDGRRSQLNGGGTGRFGTSNTRTAHNGTPRPLQCYSPVGMLNGSAVSGGSGLLIANENALDDADERSVLGTVTKYGSVTITGGPSLNDNEDEDDDDDDGIDDDDDEDERRAPAGGLVHSQVSKIKSRSFCGHLLGQSLVPRKESFRLRDLLPGRGRQRRESPYDSQNAINPADGINNVLLIETITTAAGSVTGGAVLSTPRRSRSVITRRKPERQRRPVSVCHYLPDHGHHDSGGDVVDSSCQKHRNTNDCKVARLLGLVGTAGTWLSADGGGRQQTGRYSDDEFDDDDVRERGFWRRRRPSAADIRHAIIDGGIDQALIVTNTGVLKRRVSRSGNPPATSSTHPKEGLGCTLHRRSLSLTKSVMDLLNVSSPGPVLRKLSAGTPSSIRKLISSVSDTGGDPLYEPLVSDSSTSSLASHGCDNNNAFDDDDGTSDDNDLTASDCDDQH